MLPSDCLFTRLLFVLGWNFLQTRVHCIKAGSNTPSLPLRQSVPTATDSVLLSIQQPGIDSQKAACILTLHIFYTFYTDGAPTKSQAGGESSY